MVKRRNRNKPNVTGRNPTSRFVRHDYRMLESSAYRALSCTARALLVELIMLYNGSNNGSLYLSVRDAAARVGRADSASATSAFKELTDLGFIEVTEEAHFNVKASERSRARCGRLTWLPCPKHKVPRSVYLDRQPAPKTKAHKRMELGHRAIKNYKKARDRGQLPVRVSDTLAPYPAVGEEGAVVETTTLEASNDDFPSLAAYGNSPHM